MPVAIFGGRNIAGAAKRAGMVMKRSLMHQRAVEKGARISASVVVIRPSSKSSQFEVLMVKRSPRLKSFASFQVFPGGVEDSADASLSETALRELFEETGILLGEREDGGSGICSRSYSFESSAKADLLQEKVRENAAMFSAVYQNLGIKPASRLVDFCQFLTPVFEKRRYLAHFFLTRIEKEDDARVHLFRGESTSYSWVTPQDAIELNARGMFDMLPPQFYILNTLRGYTSVFEVEDAVPMHMVHIQPHPVEMNKSRLVLAYPGDEEYPDEHSSNDDKQGRRHRLRCTLPMGKGGYEYVCNISAEQARGGGRLAISPNRAKM